MSIQLLTLVIGQKPEWHKWNHSYIILSRESHPFLLNKNPGSFFPKYYQFWSTYRSFTGTPPPAVQVVHWTTLEDIFHMKYNGNGPLPQPSSSMCTDVRGSSVFLFFPPSFLKYTPSKLHLFSFPVLVLVSESGILFPFKIFIEFHSISSRFSVTGFHITSLHHCVSWDSWETVITVKWSGQGAAA